VPEVGKVRERKRKRKRERETTLCNFI